MNVISMKLEMSLPQAQIILKMLSMCMNLTILVLAILLLHRILKSSQL